MARGIRLIWLEIHLCKFGLLDPTDRLSSKAKMLIDCVEINPLAYNRFPYFYSISTLRDFKDSGIEMILRS